MSGMDQDELGLTCLIALDEPAEIMASPLRRAFAYAAPRSSLSIEARAPSGTEQAFVMSVDGHDFAVALFAGQMPLAEYSHAVEKSLFWQDAGAAVSQHRAFLAVTATGSEYAHGLVRAQAIALTRLAAALVEVLPASGVFWQVAGTLSPPERVARAPSEIDRGKWPVDIWIGWKMFGEDDPDQPVLGLVTRGADAFLGFELAVPPFAVTDKKEPLRILHAASAYLMNYGDVLRDGQKVEVIGERRTTYQLRMAPTGERVATLTVLDPTAPTMH